MAPSLDELSKDTPIEILRLHVEMSRVSSAKNEMLLLIRERQDEIDRLKANILVQDKRINELSGLIKKGEVK
jgi:hypothetical protein